MVKCPYPFENEQIKARRERDYQWYYNNIGIKITQGSGRTMRAKDDWTMNYLIDPGFDNFIFGRGSKFIPNYIKKSMYPMPKIFTN
jgi:Rad3-related DNA helicase